MKILEFKAYYEPEIAAGVMLDGNTAEDIAARGHIVSLYTPRPCRGIAVEIGRSAAKTEYKVENRLIIHRYSMFREPKSTALRAIRYMLCCFKQLGFAMKERDAELIFAGSTPPFQGFVVRIIQLFLHVPFVFNLQDIFPESMTSAGIASNRSIAYRIGEWISNVSYKSASAIIVPSETMKQTLVAKNVPESKIHVVHNWIDEKVIHPVDKTDNQLIAEMSIPQYDFSVVYAGNLGHAQAIDIIIDAAEQLKNHKNIGFLIFGGGANKDEVYAEVCKRKLENVHLYPLLPYERVSEVYSLGDACIVSCKEGTGSNAMPSKTWSVMGCGRAVLASFDRGTLLQTIVEEEQCGLFSVAGDAKALVNNILALSDDPALCKQMGEKGRKYVEAYLTREKCTGKIAEIIEEVAKMHGSR